MPFTSIKLSPFLKDIVSTVITSVLTIVCLVIATSALAQGLGPEQFGAYSLIKRVLNNLEPWVTLSMAISVARFVALKQSGEARLTYLRCGVVLLIALLIPTLAVALLFPEKSAEILFNAGPQYGPVMISLVALIVSYSFYILLYAYYRGIGRMGLANIWQMGVIAVGPMVIALALARPGALELVIYLNAALLALSIFPLLKHLHLSTLATQNREQFRSSMNDLIRYGLPRVPGGLIYGGLLSLGPMGATYLGSLKEAGFLVIGQSILKIYEGGIEGFGRAAMPAISTRFSESGKEGLKHRVAELIALIVDMGVFLTIHSTIWMGPILLLWLGDAYEGAILPVKILTLALCPYLAFVTLRSVLDAVEERALTTGYLTLALITLVLASGIFVAMGFGANGFAAATAVALTVLGGLCARRVCQDFDIKARDVLHTKVICFNVALAVASIVLKIFWYDSVSGKTGQVVVLVSLGVLGGALYLLGLSRMNLGWCNAIRARITRV